MGEERRIILPPPYDRRRDHEILVEVPTLVGAALWLDNRHLRAWADASEKVRSVLFHRTSPDWVLAKRRIAGTECPELADAFRVFGEVLAAPTAASGGRIAAECQRVVEWALERGYTETAIEFAETAALVEPESPRYANLAGRVARNASDYARAEVWFNRGIGFSRATQDWVELTRGHLGFGILCQDLGRVRGALRHFNSGSRWARKLGLEWLSAEAQHDLMLLLTVRGRFAEAETHARRALKWYPKHHERFPLFAADIGLLLVLERNYAIAARLLKAVLRLVPQPTPRAVILALLARAQTGAGLVDELDRVERRVFRILEEHSDKEAVALWHIASAERIARRWEAAETNAARAVELAAARRDRETERLGRGLLRSIQSRTLAPPPAVARVDADFLQFVESLTARLAQWSPDRRARSALRKTWAA